MLHQTYCNTDFVDGNCTCTSSTDGMCDEASSDAWSINNETFNKMTEQFTGISGGGYLYTEILGAAQCGGKFSNEVCGYNNDLIDNGGYYWFADLGGSSDLGAFWDPSNRRVYGSSGTYAFGFRPVVNLSASVYVTGGSGTMDDPYTIARD